MDRNSVSWRGYIPAITTPFTKEGLFDRDALGALLDWLKQERMHGIIVAGTQGEWFNLTTEERHELFRIVGQRMRGSMPLIAGCNAYTITDVLMHANVAAECGFEGILVTPPPYMTPTEREIVNFYRTISAESPLPICVYNWPPGTSIDMPVSLLATLASLPKVVAIKNSTPDLRRFLDVFFALKDKVRVFGLPMDELGVTLVRHHGGDGTMGAGAVLGHELPDYFNSIWAGDLQRAREIGARNDIFMRESFHANYTGRFGSAQAIFKETLNQLGLPGGYPRLPLLPLDDAGVSKVRKTLAALGMGQDGAACKASPSSRSAQST